MNKQQVIEDMEEHLRSAQIFQNQSRLHLAIMELEAALELCEEYKITKEKRQTWSLLANIYFDLGSNNSPPLPPALYIALQSLQYKP